MEIPELTHEQRIESFISERLSDFSDDAAMFTKNELAGFCLKEIDHAIEIYKSIDVEDVEEQLAD